MKLKQAMTVALAGLVLSCPGPAAVLAQDPTLAAEAAKPQAAITTGSADEALEAR